MTSFEDFLRKTQLIVRYEADQLIQRYISRFIDMDSNYYKEYIATYKKFSDGWFYIGYLWDCLKNRKMIREEKAMLRACVNSSVFVFWDLHSSVDMGAQGYWKKFQRPLVLSLKYGDLPSGRQYLPDDVYIFDETYSWTLVFTHEYISGQQRVCYWAT